MPAEIKDITVEEIEDFINQNSLNKRDTFMFRILRNNYIHGESASKHIANQELHSPKGLLLNTKVIGWALFVMIIVSTIVAYLPEKIATLIP